MINLEKRKPINLSKIVPSLGKVKVGLSWDTSNVINADIDASVFLLNSNAKTPTEGYFVFYNNRESEDGSVSHSGDNRTGVGEGDDEAIDIDLTRVANQICSIMIVISIHNSQDGVHFGNILNSSIRIQNLNDSSIICEYKLVEKFDGDDSLVIGQFIRNNNEWSFEAIAQSFRGGLGEAVNLYC